MSYVLGIDLGTTFTAAAVCRREGRAWGPAEVVPLGTRTSAVGSVLFVDPTGAFLFGEAAERRVVTDPTSVVREFKRRIGDGTPLLVGDTPWAAADLAAHLARWVVDMVSAREGGWPDRIAFTHPAGWGRHKTSLLTTALRDVGLDDVVLLREPHAAAISYANTERIEPGTTIAVYDLGGGTFDATVLRKSAAEEFEQLGEPVGHERLGGLDFDELIFDHLRACRPEAFDRLDPNDPAQVSAVGRLRRECTEAKEGLSEDTEVVIPVLLPHLQAQARLVRSEFEAMIRPAIEETVALLASAVDSAGVGVEELSTVLLVGGSARIPLVTELLSVSLGRPIAVDADPKAAVALGAALALRSVEDGPGMPVADQEGAVTVGGPPARPVADEEPLVLSATASPRRRLPRARTLAVIGSLALAALVAGTVTGLPERLAGITSPAQAATTTDDRGAGGSGGGGGGKAGGGHGGTANGESAGRRSGVAGDPSAPLTPGVSGAPVTGPTVPGKPGVPANPAVTTGVTTAAVPPPSATSTTTAPPLQGSTTTTPPTVDPPSSSSETPQPQDSTAPAAP